MNRNQSGFNLITKKMGGVAFVVILISSPILAYVKAFGIRLTQDHNRWAEFGTFFAGIYSPIIAALALWVILRQAYLMSKQTQLQYEQAKLQFQANKFQYDRNQIENAKKDFHFQLDILRKRLAVDEVEKKNHKESIEKTFLPMSNSELKSSGGRGVAYSMYNKDPKIVDAWITLYSILKGLRGINELPYELAFISCKSHIISSFSLLTCYALDMYYCAWSNDKEEGQYIFWDPNRNFN